MNRRHFLAASAATTALAAAVCGARASKRAQGDHPRDEARRARGAEGRRSFRSSGRVQERTGGHRQAADADASYGFLSPAVIRAGKSLRWLQQPSAGVEHLIEIPELVESDIILTNMQRAYGPEIADQAIGYLLCFHPQSDALRATQSKEEWRSSGPEVVLDELAGKTLLVIALGGIGSEIARRAAAFGMRVVATDPKVLERPPFVEELHRPMLSPRSCPEPTSWQAPCL